jgi:hypothetical protein
LEIRDWRSRNTIASWARKENLEPDSRRGNLAGPVLLIGFGTLLLLINLGMVPMSIWGALARLWPLALILVGIDLLIPRRSVLGSMAVGALLLLVLFAAPVWHCRS